jgi:putative redox protein
MAEEWTEIIAAWKKDTAFTSQDTTGATLQMGTLDGKSGLSPMRLLLIALAGCTGEDIVSILRKKRLAMNDMQVRVRAKRASDYPKIWTDIHITYLVWGEAIPPRDIEQAIRLSEDKYCSVRLMLDKVARITSEYHLLQPGESAE